MRKYYHIYPTCPKCHEPHVNGSVLERSENNLRCSSCGAYFHKEIDLVSSKKFPKTLKAVIRLEGEESINYLSHIPLPWEVNLNIIEKEYIHWVNKIETGRFLITWPWREVKFIPILLGEYLLNNPDKKAAVIGKVMKNPTDRKIIDLPTIQEVFDSLIYTESPKIAEIDDEIKKEMKDFWKHVIIKKKVVSYVIKELGSKGYHAEYICDDTLIKCKKKIIKEIENYLGKNAIRRIVVKKSGSNKCQEKTINESGFIDIKIQEREQWMGKKPRYNKKWLWNVLLNTKEFRRLSKVISAIKLKDPENRGWEKKRLFFIPAEIEPQIIFGLIDSINPDLLIIQNVDDFVKDAIFGGKRSRSLFEFISRSRNSLILMFSTNPEVRYLYGINHSGEYAKNYYNIDNYNIIAHTWDSEIILEKIKKSLEKEDQGYPSPASSLLKELPDVGITPEIEYIDIESLDRIEDLLHEILDLVDDSLKGDIKKYIYDLRKSPLLIKGDYTKPEVFRRKGRILGDYITYDYLVNLIRNSGNENKFKKITGQIKDIYVTELGPINPIMKKMNEKISELLQEKKNFITVIVHKYDVKGTKILLQKRGYGNYIPIKLDVCSWSDLSQREQELEQNITHYVIATIPPSIEYPLSSSQVRKIFFVGGRRFTKKIEKIIKYRLVEYWRRPLYLLSNIHPAPTLLKEMLQDVEIQSNESIKDLTEEIIVEFEESTNSNYGGKSVTYHQEIKPGEKALLVVDSRGNGIFIPSDTTLLLRDNGKLSEFEINDISSDKNLLSKLKDKEILLDISGLYYSFRADFIKFMMRHGKKIIFRKGPYIWQGFHRLFLDAKKWIDDIRRAIDEYSFRNKIPYDKAENRISEYLSSLGLTAKDPQYIRSWWRRYEIIQTEMGSYRLYKVEHPKKQDDLLKIYKGITELLPELMIDVSDAHKSYAASLIIQRFRRAVLKGELQNVSPSLRYLYNQVSDEIHKILEGAETFKASIVYRVKISKEVEPFKLMRDFEKYIDKKNSNV